MSKSEEFLDKYRELESVVRDTYNIKNSDSISYYLENNLKYKKWSEEIKYCQEVRNLLTHSKKVDSRYAVESNDAMINFIDSLINKVKNRKKCFDVQIKFKDVYWQGINGNVKETIIKMQRNSYTHVPILDNGIVIGVFDENSIFNYLANDKIIEIDDKLTFNDIKEFLSIDNREMEEFIFFRADKYIEELEEQFEIYFRKNKRIGLVFITSAGTKNEKLQGIITPWDIIVANK